MHCINLAHLVWRKQRCAGEDEPTGLSAPGRRERANSTVHCINLTHLVWRRQRCASEDEPTRLAAPGRRERADSAVHSGNLNVKCQTCTGNSCMFLVWIWLWKAAIKRALTLFFCNQTVASARCSAVSKSKPGKHKHSLTVAYDSCKFHDCKKEHQ